MMRKVRMFVAKILWAIAGWLLSAGEWLAGVKPEPYYPVTPFFPKKLIKVKPMNLRPRLLRPLLLNTSGMKFIRPRLIKKRRV